MSTESNKTNKPHKIHKVIWIILMVLWPTCAVLDILNDKYFSAFIDIFFILVNDYMYILIKKRIPK